MQIENDEVNAKIIKFCTNYDYSHYEKFGQTNLTTKQRQNMGAKKSELLFEKYLEGVGNVTKRTDFNIYATKDKARLADVPDLEAEVGGRTLKFHVKSYIIGKFPESYTFKLHSNGIHIEDEDWVACIKLQSWDAMDGELRILTQWKNVKNMLEPPMCAKYANDFICLYYNTWSRHRA